VRRSFPPIREEFSRHLRYTKVIDGSLYDHFQREFHALTGKAKAQYGVSPEATKPTVKIIDRALVEDASDCGEQRIAKIPVQWRHRSIFNASNKAVTYHQVIASLEGPYKRI
jgi:hypothetical protein